MLTSQERRLLLLLALWIAGASLLDLLALHRPVALGRWMGEERLADVSSAGLQEPDASPNQWPDSFRKPGPAGPDTVSAPIARSRGRGRPLAYDRLGRLDLNRADAVELDLLPGVGPALASRILAERRRRGSLGSTRDLLQVRGIGPKTLAKLLPRVTVGAAKDSLGPSPTEPESSRRFAR